MSFFTELKRRHVFSAVALYAASAWLLVQVATQVFPFFHIAEWVVRWIVVGAVIGFPFAMLLAWFYEFTPKGFKRERDQNDVVRKSIAVLPLINESGNPKDEYFSDGLSEDLINSLSQLKGLRVTSRNSSFKFKNSTDDVQTIGARLSVTHLLEGRVRKLGARLRIFTEVVKVVDGSSVWSQSYDRDYKDIFDVQAEIAQSVAQALKLELLGHTLIVAADRPPNDSLLAHDAYLQGNFHFGRATIEDVRQAIVYYQQALELEPHYALALARLALAWMLLGIFLGVSTETSDAFGNSRTAARQALALDSSLAVAHVALGWALITGDWNHTDAQIEFLRALELAPEDTNAKNGVAEVFSMLGQFDTAIGIERKNLALDPLHLSWYVNLARDLIPLRRYDEAEAVLRKRLELQPGRANHVYAFLAVIAIQRGDAVAALAHAGLEPHPSFRRYALALAQFVRGDHGAADMALQTLIQQDAETAPSLIASVHACRDEADQVFVWLNRALEVRDFHTLYLLGDPFLLKLKSDPRFAAFCSKVGLPSPAK